MIDYPIPMLDACAEYVLDPVFFTDCIPHQRFIERVAADERLTEDIRTAFVLCCDMNYRKNPNGIVRQFDDLELPQALRRLLTVRVRMISCAGMLSKAEYLVYKNEPVDTGSKALDDAIVEATDMFAVHGILLGRMTDWDENLARLRRHKLLRNPHVLLKIAASYALFGYVIEGNSRFANMGWLTELSPWIRDPAAPEWDELRAVDAQAADRLAAVLFLMESSWQKDEDAEQTHNGPHPMTRLAWSLLHPEVDPMRRIGGMTFEAYACMSLWSASRFISFWRFDLGDRQVDYEAGFSNFPEIASAFRGPEIAGVLRCLDAEKGPIDGLLALPTAGCWPEDFRQFIAELHRYRKDIGVRRAALRLKRRNLTDDLRAEYAAAAAGYEEKAEALWKEVGTFTDTVRDEALGIPDRCVRLMKAALSVMDAVLLPDSIDINRSIGTLEKNVKAMIGALRAESREERMEPLDLYLLGRVRALLRRLLRTDLQLGYVYIPPELDAFFKRLEVILSAEMLEMPYLMVGVACATISDQDGQRGTVKVSKPAVSKLSEPDLSSGKKYATLLMDYFEALSERPNFPVPELPKWDAQRLSRAKKALRKCLERDPRPINLLFEEIRWSDEPAHPDFQPFWVMHEQLHPSAVRNYSYSAAQNDRVAKSMLLKLTQVRILLELHRDSQGNLRKNFDWFAPVHTHLGGVTRFHEDDRVSVALLESEGVRGMVTVGLGDEIARISRLQKRPLPKFHEEWAAPVPGELHGVPRDDERLVALVAHFQAQALAWVDALEASPVDDAKKPVELPGTPFEVMELRHLRKVKNERKVKKPGSSKGAVKIVPAVWDAPKMRFRAVDPDRLSV